jgi:hypothetical protein
MLCNLKGAYCQGSILSVNDFNRKSCRSLDFTIKGMQDFIIYSTTHSFQFLLVQGKGEGEAEDSGKHGLEHVGLNV